MAQRTATIASSVGLHARPAAIFSKAAAAATGHDVKITVNEKTVDAKSILGIMGLAAKHGDTVVLDVDGADADRVADELHALLESDLDAA
ncbi:HPr family phosphocarrier protein [Herbiconiux sp. L3-i23]|uniref:HPr family phosphocarrier protein n=1 Tax=Herbiconiux sp. L3-i23 TaxID=2905871 RepID=UPI002058902D|nr:HPr family phosphocarrier protein [Herbiconiux sp. L3-i23]BDI22500.1 phosphotransferase [Herbiconiux sp. L3-i23]